MPNWTLPKLKMDMTSWATKVIPTQIVDFQKMIALELFRKIIMRTPVDKGFLRGAWTVSIGSESSANKGKKSSAKTEDDLTGEEQAHVDDILKAVTGLPLGQVIWLANAMPYVERIEFESWSSQAPHGMVSISLTEIQVFIDQLSATMKAKGML